MRTAMRRLSGICHDRRVRVAQGASAHRWICVMRVVGVAGGPQKHQVVAGALKGGFIDVLITDEQTARFVLGI